MGGPAKVILSVALTPDDVNANFEAIKHETKKALTGIAESEIAFKLVPIAFGLQSLNASFIMDESHGSEMIEQKLSAIKGIQTVEIKGVSLYETKEFKPLTEETPVKKTSKK